MTRTHETPETGNGSRASRSATASAADPMDALAHVDAKEVLGQVESFARENPHAALAGAAVVGFVLGGGLTPRLLGALGMIAARRYMSTAMGDTLSQLLR
jgi:hypothetical protein